MGEPVRMSKLPSPAPIRAVRYKHERSAMGLLPPIPPRASPDHVGATGVANAGLGGG